MQLDYNVDTGGNKTWARLEVKTGKYVFSLCRPSQSLHTSSLSYSSCIEHTALWCCFTGGVGGSAPNVRELMETPHTFAVALPQTFQMLQRCDQYYIVCLSNHCTVTPSKLLGAVDEELFTPSNVAVLRLLYIAHKQIAPFYGCHCILQ